MRIAILVLATLLVSCTIQKTINIYIMTKKQTRPITIPAYKWTGDSTQCGVKKDPVSLTIPDDSFSVQEMMERHVQGLSDPTLYRDGQYDDENIDHDTDISHREQTSELDLIDMAREKQDLIKFYEKSVEKQKSTAEKIKQSSEKTSNEKSDDENKKSEVDS